MAKLSIVQREKKRERLIKKYLSKRNEIKAKLKKHDLDMEERSDLTRKLQRLPLNSMPTRKRNRCSLTGRPRGVYRKFGLGRTKLRETAMRGDIPGLTKASW